jgi:hypothetical protein
MKNISYFLLAAATVVFTGCGPDKKSNISTPPLTNGAINNQNQVNAPTNSGDPVQLATPQSQSGTPTTTVAMNPAHGMPNHRCDIPVGAPLNSPAQTNTIGAPRLPAPTLPMPAPGSLAAGTNPPHGQLGHDCSIPVGAPLRR